MGSWIVPRILKLLCLPMIAFLGVTIARAETVPGSRFESGRGVGMGQALIPFADDGPTGLFYNPAGIAKIRGIHFEPINFGLYSNSDFASHFNRNSINATSLGTYGPSLSPKHGMPGLGGFIFPSFYMHDIAVGVLYEQKMAAEKKVDGSIHYRSVYKFIPTAGFGLRLASGVLRFGYSFQFVNMAKGEVTAPKNTSPLEWNQQLLQGGGFSHNAGFVLSLPYEYLPSFNTVVRNIGNLKYAYTPFIVGSGVSAGQLEDERMTVDQALGMVTHLGKGLDLNSSFEYRDLTSTSGAPIIGRFALGLEFAFRNTVFVRGGVSSMLPSAGIGFKRKHSELNFSYSMADVGTAYHSAIETRYMFNYVLRAF